MPNHPTEGWWEGPDFPPDDPSPPNPVTFPVHFLVYNIAHALGCSYHFGLSDPKFPGVGLVLSSNNNIETYDNDGNLTEISRKDYVTGGVLAMSNGTKTMLDTATFTIMIPITGIGTGGSIVGPVNTQTPPGQRQLKGTGWIKMEE